MLITARRRRPASSEDEGFTLIELLITVAIIGVISSSLAGILISYFKTTVDTQSRMTESLELQFVTAYWQRDVSSIGVRDYEYNDADDVHGFDLERSVDLAPCPAAASLTHVVTLAWSEYVALDSDAAASRIEVKVSYGTRGPNGDLELVRVRCGSEPVVIAVADHLLSPPSVVCSGGGVSGCDDATGAVPTRISLTLAVRDPEGHGKTDLTATIQGERRQS